MNDFKLPASWSLQWIDKDGPLLTRLLMARGLTSAEEQETFLQPNFAQDTNDPFILKDMHKAVARLKKARQKGEVIGIYGDYDADGLPGAALLIKGLKAAGYERVIGYIPTRNEGYGMRAEGIDWLISQGVTLIVTVDTGITATSEVKYAADKGVDVIITDHHEPIDQVPVAVAVIDPKQSDCSYPNKNLVGTAVGFKLLWALYEDLGVDHTKLKWLTDLVCIATVSDMVPLVGENRTYVYYGLMALKRTKNIGLKALCRVSGIDLDSIDTYKIMYGIAPRLNAPSRLALELVENASFTENIVLKLLTTEDFTQALELAARINQINQARQALVEGYVEKIREKHPVIPEGGLVCHVEEAPSGITGLIAGRLADESGWPCFVMATEGEEVRGSARSNTTLSVVELLKKSNHLLRFGGHTQAAGWSLSKDRVGDFIREASQLLAAAALDHPKNKRLTLDTYLFSHEATLDNAASLDQLSPFGLGNPKPLFLVEGTIKEVYNLGRTGNHRRVILDQPYPSLVWFRVPFKADLSVGKKVSVAANLEVDTYASPKAQLIVKDLITHG